MVEKLLMDVYLPAAGRSWELRIPAGLNVRAAAALCAMALSEASGGLLLPSKGCMLFHRDTGRRLSGRQTLWEAGVRNGTQLILI